MLAARDEKPAFGILLVTAVGFLAARVFGHYLFQNNWFFTAWLFSPLWWPFVWTLLVLGLIWLLFRYETALEHALERRWAVLGFAAASLIIFIVFRIDSIALAGGNLRVAQIAQAAKVVYRWFDFGGLILVCGLDRFLGAVGLNANNAAVAAWRLLSFASALVSAAAAFSISRSLARDPGPRFRVFLAVFIGPQLLIYFGFVGIEGVVIAATMLFTALAVRLLQQFSGWRLAVMWVTVLGAAVAHIGGLYLVPAAAYATIRSARAGRRKIGAAWLVAGAVLVALIVATYVRVARDFGCSQYFLLLTGKGAFGDYGLFSLRHLGDILQLVFLLAPLSILLVLSAIRSPKSWWREPDAGLAVVLTVSGLVVVMILDPLNSVVLDLPRLAAYLTPWSFLAAVWLVRLDTSRSLVRFMAAATLALAAAAPMSSLPAYLRLDNLSRMSEDYFNRHDWYYRQGGLAFRDAYFQQRRFDQASRWEQLLPTRSPDELNIRGVNDLVYSDRVDEAIRILHIIKARNPYWIEPRSILAGLQMQAGRLELAKPEIDTMRMIDPYRRETLINEYTYLRDTRNYTKALEAVDRALEFFPTDKVIVTDRLLILSSTGDYVTADSLASAMIKTWPDLSYPYLIEGICAEKGGNPTAALSYYRKFLQLDPDAPDNERIRLRLQELGDSSFIRPKETK